MKKTNIIILTTIGVLAQFSAYAQELRITDKSGTTNQVTNVEIDYTVRPMVGFYHPDVEAGGIRVERGDATLTIGWQHIQSMVIVSGIGPNMTTITNKDNIVLTGVMVETNCAHIVLTDGAKRDFQLSDFGRATLSGTADIGTVSLLLENIKSIEVLQKR